MTGRLLALLLLLSLAAPAAASGGSGAGDAAETLARVDVHVDAEVAALVDADRLGYAAGVASRAADGAPMKLAFVNVPDERLNAYRDELFGRLDLDDRGALLVATPVSITLRTSTLEPDAEAAILEAHAPALRVVPRRYTEPLGELIYDVGLVVHNSTPGAEPRGLGPNGDLRTFTGSFADEGDAVLPVVAGAVALAAAALAGVVLTRRRRPA